MNKFKLWLVPGATHARSRQVAGKDEYKSHINMFLTNAEVIEAEALEDAA